MTDDGFRADVPTIKEHAGKVQDFANQIGSAHGAAQTSMDSNAFGIFGQFLASATIAQCEVVKDSIEGGKKALEKLKSNLDATAADYEATDQESSAILKGVEGGK